MKTINEMCELTPPCECDCNPDKDLSQGNIRPNYSPSPCGADGGVCGEHILEHPLHLWAIKYGVEGHLKFIGVAVVQAPTRSAAECIFAKNSLFSGTPERLKILAMKEVMPWSEPILFEDCAAIIDRHNLKSYPFLLKSDYEHNIQNISDNVIEAVEDYIEHNPFQQVNSDWNETDENSKAYILNKPEIPDAQVQSNWNETDTNSKAYILNKPEIPDAQIQSDWSENNTSSKAFIRNKPTDLVRTSDIEGLLRNDGSVYTGKYLEQVRDLDNFQASEGKIVQYIGETNAKYTNSYIYKKVGTEIVIPAGTEYINIQDSYGALTSVGIPNGIYYKINDTNDKIKYDENNPTKSRICYQIKTPNNSIGYPVKKYNNVTRGVLGLHGYIDGQFSKIIKNDVYISGETGVEYENGQKCSYNMIDGGNTLLNSESVNIYENEDGIRVYVQQGNFGYGLSADYRYVLVLEYDTDDDIYRAIAGRKAFCYKFNTTTSQQSINNSSWQQCVPPEEDTSHYVLDSDIGWIEH